MTKEQAIDILTKGATNTNSEYITVKRDVLLLALDAITNDLTDATTDATTDVTTEGTDGEQDHPDVY